MPAGACVTPHERDGGKTDYVSPKPRLSIVLPCYNEAPNLTALLGAYKAALRNTPGVEVIVIDNGSTDDTSSALEPWRRDPLFKIVRLERNLGYGGGVWAGLRRAAGDFVGWSHADQQCPAEDVVRLYEQIQGHAQSASVFAKGVRTNARGFAGFLSWAHGVWASIVLGHRLREINAQPKIFSRSLLEAVRNPPQGFELDTYFVYLAKQMRFREVNIDVTFLKRPHGESKWATSLVSRLRFIKRQFFYVLELRRDEVIRSLRNRGRRVGRPPIPN